MAVVKERMQSLNWRYEKTESNVLLHSSYWPEQILNLIRWMALYPSPRRLIVGGNSPTTNPCPYLALGAEVFLGDGELFDFDSPHLIRSQSDTPKTIGIAEKVFPISGYVDAQKEGKSSRRYFCEISRGCKNRCAFCQYGWIKPYREAPFEYIRAVIDATKSKSVRVFAADRFQHSQYPEIRKYLTQKKLKDTGSDLSIRFVAKHPEYLKLTTKFRTGIEGMSERLRIMVRKPITNAEIIRIHQLAFDAGIRCFDWYMIYGLPTENEDDTSEFLELLGSLEKVLKGHVLAIHWNAFQPNALTPFQWAAPAFPIPRARMECIDKSRYSFKIMHKPLLTSDSKIAMRTILSRAGLRSLDLLKALAFKPQLAQDVRGMRNRFRALEGFDPLVALDPGAELPWDRYVQYDKRRLEKIYASINSP